MLEVGLPFGRTHRQVHSGSADHLMGLPSFHRFKFIQPSKYKNAESTGWKCIMVHPWQKWTTCQVSGVSCSLLTRNLKIYYGKSTTLTAQRFELNWLCVVHHTVHMAVHSLRKMHSVTSDWVHSLRKTHSGTGDGVHSLRKMHSGTGDQVHSLWKTHLCTGHWVHSLWKTHSVTGDRVHYGKHIPAQVTEFTL